MAVKSTHLQTGFSLRYKDGMDNKGKDILKTKKFSKVKVDAEDQNIYDTADALSKLMEHEVVDIIRTNDNILMNA